MPSERRISLKDIAASCGVHLSTVSKALSGDPHIADATRRRVAEAAQSLGYAPDPMLLALAGYRRRKRPSQEHAVLAWVNNFSRAEKMSQYASYADYLNGARARAEQLGYRIDEFWAGGSVAKRDLARILHSRGIEGLIIAPQVKSHAQMTDWPWDRFAAVTIGYSLSQPSLWHGCR